jgi:hypothetical protein
MRVLIHPPSKNGVTRVTGVTKSSNPLNINNLIHETRKSVQRYPTCYVAEPCNNIYPATLLSVERAYVVKRWAHDPKLGRGVVNGR